MSHAAAPLPDTVKVVVGFEDAHLFRYVARSRIRVVEPDEAGKVDLILFACSRSLDFTETEPALAPSVWAQAAAGSATVVFDASGEGQPHIPERTRRLHGFLERMGVSPDRAVYLTQDRGYEADYAAYCAQAGGGPRMRVLNYDYWIRRVLRDMASDGASLHHAWLAAYRARPRRRERRFVALTYTPRPSKALFLLRLMQDGLWDRGFVSFGGFGPRFGHKRGDLTKFARQMRSLEGFEDMAESLVPLLPALDAKGEVVFGAETHADNVYSAALDFSVRLPEHDRSWFSVAVESEMMARPCRITEKPFRPLMNFHPFLVLGNPGSLRMLRDLGFQTFPELFDEAYDDEDDPRRRFEMVYAELSRLCAADEAELDRIDAAISDKVELNAHWAMCRLPEIYRKRIDLQLLAQLLPVRSAP